jgi:hypothetical protein
MKNIFKRSFLLFSLLLVGSTNNSLKSCGWYGSEFEDVRFSLFNSNLLQDKSWWAFFYTSHSYFMDASVFGDKDETTISNEWKSKFKLDAPIDSIKSYLFGRLSEEAAANNPFYLEIKKDPELESFFNFAKDCESSVYLDDPWENLYENSLIQQRGTLINQGVRMLNKQTNLFWKKKYAFQLIRLAYYQNDVTVFNGCFNTYFGLGKEKTALDWWATHYKSMMYEREQKLDSANYLHALVFSNSSNKMYVSKYNFSDKRMKSILRLTKSNKEKADVYVIAAMNEPGKSLTEIKRVYALFPEHPLLPLLVLREMNKVENWMGTYKYNLDSPLDETYCADITKIGKNDYVYLQSLYKQVQSMVKLEKENPDFYHLICANLALICTDEINAKKYLVKVTTKNPNMVFQKNVLETILVTISSNITNNNVQNDLANKLEILINTREGKFKSQNMLYSLFRFMEYSFRSKGMNHMAGLFNYIAVDKLCQTCGWNSFEYGIVAYFDRSATASDLEKLVKMYDDPEKNKLAKFLLKPYTNPYFFHEVMGTKYLRTGNITMAKKTWDAIPVDFWDHFTNSSNYLDEDPFSMNEYENRTRKYPYFNKAQIVNRLNDINSKSKKSFYDWILLGNAWFNFSGEGNSWFMLDYEWSGYRSESSKMISRYPLSQCIKCYTEAAKLAVNDEEKAQITYYIATYYLMSYSKEEYLKWVDKYEKFSDTHYYGSVNCTVSEALQSPEFRKKYFGWDWDYYSEN